MKNRVFRPGDELPTDPGVQASYGITRSTLKVADQAIIELTPLIGEGKARSCVFSGMLSAAANLALNADKAESAAFHLLRASMEIRPQPPAAGEVFRLAQSFVDLMNVAGERHDVETVVIAMLNAVANAGTATGDTSWVAEHMRDFANMLTDPARMAQAEAAAVLATRPADTVIQ